MRAKATEQATKETETKGGDKSEGVEDCQRQGRRPVDWMSKKIYDWLTVMTGESHDSAEQEKAEAKVDQSTSREDTT